MNLLLFALHFRHTTSWEQKLPNWGGEILATASTRENERIGGCAGLTDDDNAFLQQKLRAREKEPPRLDLGPRDVARLDRSLELLVLALEVLQARLGRLDRLLQRLELFQLLRGASGVGSSGVGG